MQSRRRSGEDLPIDAAHRLFVTRVGEDADNFCRAGVELKIGEQFLQSNAKLAIYSPLHLALENPTQQDAGKGQRGENRGAGEHHQAPAERGRFHGASHWPSMTK